MGATWNTEGLIKYLERQWLQRGMDQTTFLNCAGLSNSLISNWKAASRGPALHALVQIRNAYGIEIDTMVDILEGRARVDEYGNLVY